mmetsp:Transcript_35835/g.103060  ORF Transcript_35835/g.103060 Transcript_35835/m.103060 type:complete len:336 (+) Transcript_35835:488-1495(+)
MVSFIMAPLQGAAGSDRSTWVCRVAHLSRNRRTSSSVECVTWFTVLSLSSVATFAAFLDRMTSASAVTSRALFSSSSLCKRASSLSMSPFFLCQSLSADSHPFRRRSHSSRNVLNLSSREATAVFSLARSLAKALRASFASFMRAWSDVYLVLASSAAFLCLSTTSWWSSCALSNLSTRAVRLFLSSFSPSISAAKSLLRFLVASILLSAFSLVRLTSCAALSRVSFICRMAWAISRTCWSRSNASCFRMSFLVRRSAWSAALSVMHCLSRLLSRNNLSFCSFSLALTFSKASSSDPLKPSTLFLNSATFCAHSSRSRRSVSMAASRLSFSLGHR